MKEKKRSVPIPLPQEEEEEEEEYRPGEKNLDLGMINRTNYQRSRIYCSSRNQLQIPAYKQVKNPHTRDCRARETERHRENFERENRELRVLARIGPWSLQCLMLHSLMVAGLVSCESPHRPVSSFLSQPLLVGLVEWGRSYEKTLSWVSPSLPPCLPPLQLVSYSLSAILFIRITCNPFSFSL